MCTLVTAFHHFTDFPLVVAANRDERLTRPSSPPRLFAEPGEIPALAPVDELAHGTWLGLNARRLFVAITNRFGAVPHPERSSRGMLVKRALAQPSARAVRTELEGLLATDVNPFHLFYADPDEAFLTCSDGDAIHHRALEPGVFIITERSFSPESALREAHIRALWNAQQTRRDGPDVEGLKAMLADHGAEDTLGGPCVHAPAFNYGTRSATLVTLGATDRFLYSEGPPCEGRGFEPFPLPS